MGVLDRLREGLFRVRVIPRPSDSDVTSFANEQNSLPNKIDEAVEAGKRIDLSELMELTTLTGDRNYKYGIFEEMVADGRIGAAIEMYANDTVQYNPEGKVIWIEAENADVAKYAQKILDDLNIADNIWSYAYCMYLYGDVYLETFASASVDGSKPALLYEPLRKGANVNVQQKVDGIKMERYIEKVPNPAEMYDLQSKGKTSGYIRNIDSNSFKSQLQNNIYTYNQAITDVNIMNPTKFVHICLSPNIDRFPEKFNLIQEDKEKIDENGNIDGTSTEGTGTGGTLSFSVKAGQSILENVYGVYQTLKLKEDSLLLERVTKSSITRVIQVELGDLPEAQKKRKLQEIKNQIEQQLIMNKEAGTLQSRSGAQPVENIIYTTTKDGKGGISTVNIGGDADIGNTEDITQTENKLFGSLLTPKAVLGADMDGTGLSNGGSLTELNTTYARRIKRGQIALTTGIRDLINIFALADGVPDVVNNFSVKLTPIITAEDNRRDELLKDKIGNVDQMIGLLDYEKLDEDIKLKIMLQWFGKYLNQQEIVSVIDEYLKKLEQEETSDDYDNDLEEKGMDDDKGPNIDIDITPPSHSSFGGETFTDIGSEESEEHPEPELADQENLADIEGEDLL